MNSTQTRERVQVGSLICKCTTSNDVVSAPQIIPIFASKQSDIGRKHVHELLGLTDDSISTHHLRVRCVIYDEDDTTVPPAVFVQAITKEGVVQVHGHDKIVVTLTRSSSAYMLADGDLIYMSPKVTFTFRSDCSPYRKESLQLSDHAPYVLLSSTDKCSSPEEYSPRNKYLLTKHMLGKGASAKVFVAIRTCNGQQLACKVFFGPVMGIDRLSHSQKMQIDREIEILRKLNHANIIELADVVYYTDQVFILQSLATGGDLFSYLRLHSRLKEKHIIIVIYQLVHAVKYLHDSGIVHRDIKLENILLTSWRSGGRVMLTDFGQARDLSHSMHPNQSVYQRRMDSRVGTAGWMAPELENHSHQYGAAIDVWAIGVVTLAMFTHDMPENSRDAHRMASALSLTPELLTQSDSIRHLASIDAQCFVKDCLCEHEAQRITAAEAMGHRWFTHPLYALELEAVYQHAIASWRPHREQSPPRSPSEGHQSHKLYAGPVEPSSGYLPHADYMNDDHLPRSATLHSEDVATYQTQATMLIRGSQAATENAPDTLMDLDPPLSAQVGSLSFQDPPESLLRSQFQLSETC